MKFVKILFAVFVMGILLEFGSRLYLALHYQSPEYTYYGAFGHQRDPYLGFTLKPNVRDFPSKGLNTVYSTNSAGFRGKAEYGSKKENELRIVFLGESSIFGHSATSDETSVGPQLESKLKKLSPDREISVINAGNPGHISYQVLAKFILQVLPYDPDVVVIYTGWNDLFNAADLKPFKKNYFRRFDIHYDLSWQRFIEYENARVTDHPGLQKSAAYLLFDRTLTHIRGRTHPPPDPSLKSKTVDHPEVEARIAEQLYENLSSLQILAKSRNIKVIFVTLFSEFDLFGENRKMLNETLRKVARDTDSLLIDADEIALKERLKGINSPRDKYHLTDKGNEWLAGLVSEKIASLSS